MPDQYTLHYAPDNASLVVRLALDEMGVPFQTRLVDRRSRAQTSQAYLALNPHGLIPVLETPQGVIFETAAILLWLADTHRVMAPRPDDTDRGDFLKWLFFASNTMHADLRMLFYTELYAGSEQDVQDKVRESVKKRLLRHLSALEQVAQARTSYLGSEMPSVIDYYVACMMRWRALYPARMRRDWFSAEAAPHLTAMLTRLEARPAVQRAIQAEGLGDAPFTRPVYPVPPEGSAT